MIRRYAFWIVLGVGLAARLWHALTFPADRLVWPDEHRYDQIGWTLAQTGHYESKPYDATPVLPVFLGGVYATFGHNYIAARVCHALTAALLIAAVYGVGRRLFDEDVGLLAATGVALYPPLVYLSGVLYAEHLASVLLAATVYALVRHVSSGRLAWAVAAGASAGLTALCRPAYLLLAPLAALCLVRRWRSALALAGAALLVIAPWTVRNQMVFGQFLPVASGFGMHLWWGNNDRARGDADDRHLVDNSEPRQPAAPVDEIEGDRSLARAALRWAAAHPGRALELCGRRLMTLYTAFTRTREQNETSNPRTRLLAQLSFYPVLALGLAGLVMALRRQPASWCVVVVFVANVLPFLVSTASTRFRLPVDAWWILFAAVAVASVWRRATGNPPVPPPARLPNP